MFAVPPEPATYTLRTTVDRPDRSTVHTGQCGVDVRVGARGG